MSVYCLPGVNNIRGITTLPIFLSLLGEKEWLQAIAKQCITRSAAALIWYNSSSLVTHLVKAQGNSSCHDDINCIWLLLPSAHVMPQHAAASFPSSCHELNYHRSIKQFSLQNALQVICSNSSLKSRTKLARWLQDAQDPWSFEDLHGWRFPNLSFQCLTILIVVSFFLICKLATCRWK